MFALCYAPVRFVFFVLLALCLNVNSSQDSRSFSSSYLDCASLILVDYFLLLGVHSSAYDNSKLSSKFSRLVSSLWCECIFDSNVLAVSVFRSDQSGCMLLVVI